MIQQHQRAALEAGHQPGLPGRPVVLLEDTAPARRTTGLFRLSVTQDYDDSPAAGRHQHERDHRPARHQLPRHRDLRPVEVGADLGRCRRPATARRRRSGLVGKLGVKFSRTAIGRTFSWTLGPPGQPGHPEREHGPRSTCSVRASGSPFAEMTDHGDAEPLADVRGSMVVAYDSSLAGPRRRCSPRTRSAPHAEAVSRSIPVAVDAGDSRPTRLFRRSMPSAPTPPATRSCTTPCRRTAWSPTRSGSPAARYELPWSSRRRRRTRRRPWPTGRSCRRSTRW